MKRQLIWVSVIAAVFTSGFFLGRISLPAGPRELPVSFSDVLNRAQAGQVKEVTINGTAMLGKFTTGEQFRTTIPSNDQEMYDTLESHGVAINVKDENSNVWTSTLISIVPLVLVAGVPVLGLCLIVFVILRYRAPVKSI